MTQGETEKALKRAWAQLQVFPDNPLIYNLLGGIYWALKQTDRAEEAFKKGIELNENVLPLYFNLARLYTQNKSYDHAIQQYEKVIASNPKLLPPYALLGILYTQKENYPQANAYFQKALDISPKFAVAANNLAWNYAEHGGNLDVALTLAQTAKEQAPEDPTVTDTLGWIYYKKNAYNLAIGQLQESVKKHPDAHVVYYHLGMAYYKKGDKALAKKALQQSLQLHQDFPGAQEAREVLQGLQ